MNPVANWKLRYFRLRFFLSLSGFVLWSVWYRPSWAIFGCCGFGVALIWYMLKKEKEARLRHRETGRRLTRKFDVTVAGHLYSLPIPVLRPDHLPERV